MDLKVLLIADRSESFVTVREWAILRARVGLRIVVLVKVIFEEDFRFKCFLTPVVRAGKRLIVV